MNNSCFMLLLIVCNHIKWTTTILISISEFSVDFMACYGFRALYFLAFQSVNQDILWTSDPLWKDMYFRHTWGGHEGQQKRQLSESRMSVPSVVRSFMSKVMLLLIWTLPSKVTRISFIIFYQILIFKSQYSIVCFYSNFLRSCWGER